MIQRINTGSQLAGSKNGQVGAFGQVLAEQAVGVLIGAPFPGVIRMGEEDRQAEPPFKFRRTSEFAAIVQGQAATFGRGQSADRLS